MLLTCVLSLYVRSLIQDRSLNLMDGTRLLGLKRYKATKQAAGLSDQEMSERYDGTQAFIGQLLKCLRLHDVYMEWRCGVVSILHCRVAHAI
jgi:hypothetical protein